MSTVRTAPPRPPVCLPQTPNPTHSTTRPCHPFPATPPCLYPGLLGVDAPSPPAHRPLGCLCVLVRGHCFMVSWCDRAGAGRRACDSGFSCPPPVFISRVFSLPMDSKCVDYGAELRVLLDLCSKTRVISHFHAQGRHFNHAKEYE